MWSFIGSTKFNFAVLFVSILHLLLFKWFGYYIIFFLATLVIGKIAIMIFAQFDVGAAIPPLILLKLLSQKGEHPPVNQSELKSPFPILKPDSQVTTCYYMC